MAEAKKSFLLRLDPRLWAEVQAWADAELRSVNGQIEFVLRQAVAARRKGAAGVRRTPRGGACGRTMNPKETNLAGVR